MEEHWVAGRYQVSGEKQGTSLAVRQWFEIACGVVPVHKPDNGFRTVRLMAEERYCLGCCGLRWHDVLEGWHAGLVKERGKGEVNFRIVRCRVCEKVSDIWS